MAIVIHTKTPQKLLNDIKKVIDEGERHPQKEGVTKGWKYDKDGILFHTKDDWTELLWLKPEITDAGISIRTISPFGKILSAGILGHRQGQFSGMLLTHFANGFEDICIIP